MRYRAILWPAVLCLAMAPGNIDCLAAASDTATPLYGAVIDSLPLPGGEVTGLAWLNAQQLAVLSIVPKGDAGSGARSARLVFLDRDGAIAFQQDVTGTLARGLACDGENFWSCSDRSDGSSLLTKIDADSFYVKEAFPTLGHHPCGVSWDGDSVWVVDRDSGRLDRFDPETGDVTRSLLTPGFSPYGLALDGRHTWISDSGTGCLYRLAGDRGRWDATVDTESFAFRGRDVVLAIFDGFLWYAPADGSQAYRLAFP